jgi:hypothetical protein
MAEADAGWGDSAFCSAAGCVATGSFMPERATYILVWSPDVSTVASSSVSPAALMALIGSITKAASASTSVAKVTMKCLRLSLIRRARLAY